MFECAKCKQILSGYDDQGSRARKTAAPLRRARKVKGAIKPRDGKTGALKPGTLFGGFITCRVSVVLRSSKKGNKTCGQKNRPTTGGDETAPKELAKKC